MLSKRLTVARKNLVLLMNSDTGGGTVQDLVHMINATTTGDAGFDTALNRSFPIVGTVDETTYFTSCKFPTGSSGLNLTAGMDMSIEVVTKTPWAGGDSSLHYFTVYEAAAATNGIRIYYNSTGGGQLNYYVYDNAGASKYCTTAATSSEWPADTVHIIVCTRDSSGTLDAYLDGTQFGTVDTGAGTGLESSLGTDLYIGSFTGSNYQANAPIGVAVFDRVLSGDEIDLLSNMTQWPTRSMRIG